MTTLEPTSLTATYAKEKIELHDSLNLQQETSAEVRAFVQSVSDDDDNELLFQINLMSYKYC